MKQYTTQLKPEDLNETEFKVLLACAENVDHNTGCQFGYGDEVKVEGLTKHQITGYLSRFCQKRYMTIDDEYQQMIFEDKAVLLFDCHTFFTYWGSTRKNILEQKEKVQK